MSSFAPADAKRLGRKKESPRWTHPVDNMSTSATKRPRDDASGESAVIVSPPEDVNQRKPTPMNLATISSGFEKGDFLVREEKVWHIFSREGFYFLFAEDTM